MMRSETKGFVRIV